VSTIPYHEEKNQVLSLLFFYLLYFLLITRSSVTTRIYLINCVLSIDFILAK